MKLSTTTSVTPPIQPCFPPSLAANVVLLRHLLLPRTYSTITYAVIHAVLRRAPLYSTYLPWPHTTFDQAPRRCTYHGHTYYDQLAPHCRLRSQTLTLAHTLTLARTLTLTSSHLTAVYGAKGLGKSALVLEVAPPLLST